MNLIEFVLREQISRHVKTGVYIFERNWLLVRGVTSYEEFNHDLTETAQNIPDWDFVEEESDATAIKVSWLRRDHIREPDEIPLVTTKKSILDSDSPVQVLPLSGRR